MTRSIVRTSSTSLSSCGIKRSSGEACDVVGVFRRTGEDVPLLGLICSVLGATNGDG